MQSGHRFSYASASDPLDISWKCFVKRSLEFVKKVQTTNMEDLTKKGSEMAQKSLAKLEAVGSTAIASIKEEVLLL